jgi:peptide deformylase
MYDRRGIGLAATQVGISQRLFVINQDPEQDKAGEAVFINPVLSGFKGSCEGEEGCLSVPGVYCKVIRPKSFVVNAYDLAGNEIHCRVDGSLARLIQHETDHLDGVLFIDRVRGAKFDG